MHIHMNDHVGTHMQGKSTNVSLMIHTNTAVEREILFTTCCTIIEWNIYYLHNLVYISTCHVVSKWQGKCKKYRQNNVINLSNEEKVW